MTCLCRELVGGTLRRVGGRGRLSPCMAGDGGGGLVHHGREGTAMLVSTHLMQYSKI